MARRALNACDPARDQEARERFGDDTGTVAMSCLAVTSWQLGEVERARELIEAANRRGAELGHVPSMANPLVWKSALEVFRGDAAAALVAAEAAEALSREHGMTFWRVMAELNAGWARGRLYDPVAGAAELKKALAALADQGARVPRELFEALLAQLEAEAVGVERALARIDDALAVVHQGEVRFYLAFLHRLRGDLLLKRDPGEPSLAGDAFREAITVAKEQGARSYDLQAALPLAKLLPINRPPRRSPRGPRARARRLFADARNARDRGGEALLAALSETDEVKVRRGAAAATDAVARCPTATRSSRRAARARRKRRQLSPEPASRRLATTDAPERLAADYGLWVGSYMRGELPSMRAHAAAFLSDVAARPDSSEAGVAHRAAGTTCLFAGEYREAQDHLERALALFQPGRDDDLAFRFGADPGVGAMAYLATALWPLGEVDRAVSLIDRMQTRIVDLTHVGHARGWKTARGCVRIDAWRHSARRAERLRTRPPRARA